MSVRGRGWVLGCAAIALAVGCGDDSTAGGGGSGGTPAAGGEGGGGAPQGSSTTTAMDGGGGSASSDIGKACEEDSDCMGATAICLKPSDSLPNIPMTGGPAGGYCSQPCGDDDECGGEGICDLVDGKGVCFLLCEKGSGDNYDAALDPGKCWGREDVACSGVMTATGEAEVCLPTCGEDVQCPNGRVCDPTFRWCVDDPSDGQAQGTACAPGGVEECAGICLGVNATQGVCSVRCVYGGDQVATNDCGGIEAGICAATDSAAGDESICLASCSTQSACFVNHLVCQHVPQLGAYSYCLPPLPCPNGQADCNQIGGTTCGAGPDGVDVCLDDTIPMN